jgi:hypothetical protein
LVEDLTNLLTEVFIIFIIPIFNSSFSFMEDLNYSDYEILSHLESKCPWASELGKESSKEMSYLNESLLTVAAFSDGIRKDLDGLTDLLDS